MNTPKNAESQPSHNSPEPAPENRTDSSPQTSGPPPSVVEEQQHSVVIFTKHEEDGSFRVEIVMPKLPTVGRFVVKWECSSSLRQGTLAPRPLQELEREPTPYTPENMLQVLRDQRLSRNEWEGICRAEYGVSRSRFFELLRRLQGDGRIQKSALDGNWEETCKQSKNRNPAEDQ